MLEQVVDSLVESQNEEVAAGHCGTAGPEPPDVVAGSCSVLERTSEEVVISTVIGTELVIPVVVLCEDKTPDELNARDELGMFVVLGTTEELATDDESDGEIDIATKLDVLIIDDEGNVEEDDDDGDELLLLLDCVVGDGDAEVIADDIVLDIAALELMWEEEANMDGLNGLDRVDELCAVDVAEGVLGTTIPATKSGLPAVNIAEAVLKKHIPPTE